MGLGHAAVSSSKVALRRAAKSVAALALCTGGLALMGVLGAAAPGAGASNPAPTLYVANPVNGPDGSVDVFPFGASGDVAPAAIVDNTLGDPGGEALTASGDLWVANTEGHNISEFTPAQLASSANPTPAVVITASAGLTGFEPMAVAFDSHGDLWVSDFAGPLVEYTPSELATTGNPAPAVVISGTPAEGWGVTFDSAGNLWLGEYEWGGQLVEYTANELTSSGTQSPAVSIGGLDGPVYPTFDAKGDLWVSSLLTPSVNEYTPSQLTSSGSPTPAVRITGSEFTYPSALAFDTSGDLYVADDGSSGIFEFTPGQLTTGTPSPASTLQGTTTTLSDEDGLAINEPPVVTSVSPQAGAAGATVTIDGAGFLPGSSVDFGPTPATSVTYVTPYELEAVAPQGTGTQHVTVSTSGGTSATSAADEFSYPTNGYWEVASDGGIFNYHVPFDGSEGGVHLNSPVVGMAEDNATGGYWEVASDGGIFSFNAPFHGSMGGQHLNAPIVGMAATADGGGYWLVASDGGIFAFGDAKFSGSEGGVHLNSPVVGLAPDNATGGYWEVASDGGIFSFGAPFLGSRGGQPLNAPIVGMTGSADGGGYWLVAKDGGIFNYGDAAFWGSTGGVHLNEPVVGMAADSSTGGYWLVASDGGIFSYDAPFLGSTGGQHLNAPVVGMAAG